MVHANLLKSLSSAFNDGEYRKEIVDKFLKEVEEKCLHAASYTGLNYICIGYDEMPYPIQRYLLGSDNPEYKKIAELFIKEINKSGIEYKTNNSNVLKLSW